MIKFRTDTQFFLPIIQIVCNAIQDGFKRHAPRCVPLGVEKNLGVHHVVGLAFFEVGEGQVLKIQLGLQHAHPLIINIEEILQVAEIICLPHLGGAGKRQSNGVAFPQIEQHLRLEAAFNMEMQFNLRHAGDKDAQIGHGVYPFHSSNFRNIFLLGANITVREADRNLISFNKDNICIKNV